MQKSFIIIIIIIIIIVDPQEVKIPGVKNRVKTSWNGYMLASSSTGKSHERGLS